MNNDGSRRRLTGIKALGAAALIFATATTATGWAAGDSNGPQASASAKSKVAKQLKSLQKRIAALESKSGTPATGGAPSGPAGGALTGQFPNPGLAPNSVTGETIANNAVTGSEVATDSIGASEVLDGNLNGDDVGHAAGTLDDYDAPSVPAFECVESNVDVADLSLASDAIVVSMGAGWNDRLSVTTEVNDTTTGFISLNICNMDDTSTNNPPVDLHWVAFDV
jgi:hypothetical protein